MNIRTFLALVLTTLALNLVLFNQSLASTIRVKCEVRKSAPLRSKISVDGAGLSGKFYAQVKSGGVIKNSGNKNTDSANEVQFDFDSSPSDIAAGATAIPAKFIQNNTVYGYIRRAVTFELVGSAKATCNVK